ncbi:MAG: STAS domain-containing protein [Pirellulaceae bacterium]|nr:STAS domain-containing protein [Pirellulaceae bacterium]
MPTVQLHGSVMVLRPTGPLREENLEVINEDLRPQLSGSVPHLVIDLAETPLIDGAGLEWILDIDEECCRRGGGVRVCNVGELCHDLFRITDVGTSVQQFSDLTSALSSFA